MVQKTKAIVILPVVVCAFGLIVVADFQLRKMERFEELVARGQGIDSPLADYLHRKFGSTLAVKQIREDLEFELEPARRIRLWSDLADAHKEQNDTAGVIEACQSLIKEFPKDPRALGAYEELVKQLAAAKRREELRRVLQEWADTLLDMGEEAKLSEIMRWWEISLQNPRMVDETPVLEKINEQYDKHVLTLGALKALRAAWLTGGKMEGMEELDRKIDSLSKRGSPAQRNQSELQAIQFMANRRMWEPLREQLVFVFERFAGSSSLEQVLQTVQTESAEALGPDRQLDYYKRVSDAALKALPAANHANNLPLAQWLGDYATLLWKRGRSAEAMNVVKALRTLGPRSQTALQIERLLWLKDPGFPMRVPHAQVTTMEAPPQIDGHSSDLCWYGDDHFVGNLGPVGNAEPMPTKIWACYDTQYLYVFVKCVDPASDKIFQQGARDQTWLNDCVELFFNVRKDYTSYFQLIGNIRKAQTAYRFDILNEDVKNASIDPKTWPTSAEFAVASSPDSWNFEARVPWKDLGVDPIPGTSFFFNARRFRYVDAHRQLIYSWAPVLSSAHEPEAFGVIVLK